MTDPIRLLVTIVEHGKGERITNLANARHVHFNFILHGRGTASSDILDMLGLGDVAQEKASSLPYGKQRYLEIARALATEPRLLLLDEPFNALNKEGQEKLSEIIRDMRDKGSLILLSSHDKDELENLSDVIYLVDSGRFKLK